MSTASPAYFEIIEFIAAGTSSEGVAHFQPSPEAQKRLADLIEREKEGGLPPDERAELDHFMELEHILRMAKAKARQILAWPAISARNCVPRWPAGLDAVASIAVFTKTTRDLLCRSITS